MSILTYKDENSNIKPIISTSKYDYEVDFYSTTSISLPSASSITVQEVTFSPTTTGEVFTYIYNNKLFSIGYSTALNAFYVIGIIGSDLENQKRYLITQGTYKNQVCTYNITTKMCYLSGAKHLLEPADATLPTINITDCFEFEKVTDIAPTLNTDGTLSSLTGHTIYIKLKWPYLNTELSSTDDTCSRGNRMYIEVSPSCFNKSTSTTSTVQYRRAVEEGFTLKITSLGVVSSLYISGYIVNENGTKIYNLSQFSYDIYEDAGTDIDKYINGTLLGVNKTTGYSSLEVYPSQTEPYAIMQNCEAVGTNYYDIVASNNTYDEIPCLYTKPYFSKGDNFIFANTTFSDLKGVVSSSTMQVIDEEYQVGGIYYASAGNPSTNPIYSIVEDQTEMKQVVSGNAGTGRFKLYTQRYRDTNNYIYTYKIPIANSVQLDSFVSMSIKTTQTGSSSFIIQLQLTNNSNFRIWPGGIVKVSKNGSVSFTIDLSSWTGDSGIDAKATKYYTLSSSATSSSEYTIKTYGYVYYYLDSNRTIIGGRYNNYSAYDAGLYYFTPTISWDGSKVYLTNKDNLFDLIGDDHCPTVGIVIKKHSRCGSRTSRYITKTQKTGYAVCWERYIDNRRYYLIKHPTYTFSLDKDTGEIIGMGEFLKHFERTYPCRRDEVGTNLGDEFEGYTDDSGYRYHKNQYYGVVFKNSLYESNFSSQSIKVSYKGAKKLITGYSDD